MLESFFFIIVKRMQAEFLFDAKTNQYMCTGNWSILYLEEMFLQFKKNPISTTSDITISGKALTYFDSAGALMLMQLMMELQKNGNSTHLINFTQHQLDLIHVVEHKKESIYYTPLSVESSGVVHDIGVETVNKVQQIGGFIALIGDLSDKLYYALTHWRSLRVQSIIAIVGTAGINALPIVGLLSFLIGVVLAYQMGLQLETYGANIFIAYLSGMAVFREFGPLITAIIVAGRTSSSFTAQIGSMKINEEIDALYTLGLSPTELLVSPKVIGLLIALPLLIFWANIFGILGAMLMSKFKLNVSYADFLYRLQDTVGLKHFLLGMYKAPSFALLIALVGCFQGFRVDANADSVGRQTTRSVVQALFLIILVDALYSVIYSWMGL